MSKKKKATKRGKYHKWLQPRNLLLLESWARKLTNEQIAENIGINPKTLYDWMKKYPEISETLSQGKQVVVSQVENALIKRALGYEYDEVKREESDDGSKITVTTKQLIPDVTAQIFILKNMYPENWCDQRDVEVSGELVNPFENLSTEELRKLAKSDS